MTIFLLVAIIVLLIWIRVLHLAIDDLNAWISKSSQDLRDIQATLLQIIAKGRK
jgi:hypothetical protein